MFSIVGRRSAPAGSGSGAENLGGGKLALTKNQIRGLIFFVHVPNLACLFAFHQHQRLRVSDDDVHFFSLPPSSCRIF